MAGKGALIKDEKVVIYAEPANVSFWSFWGLILSGFLLLPLFGVWLIVWLFVHKLKPLSPAYSAPRRATPRSPR